MHAAQAPADVEASSDRVLRHGFVWLLAAFTSAGGMFQGYAIGLGSTLGLRGWDRSTSAFSPRQRR